MLLNRNCGGVSNRLQRTYHAGETTDLNRLVQLVKQRFPGKAIMVFGYSLGGNSLLKWLGEQGSEAGITAAAAVSVPFDLSSCTDRMNRGFSKVYQKNFVDLLKASAQRKFSSLPPLFDVGNIEEIRTLREFDNRITAPLHGFKNAEDYYSKSSCKAFLKTIRVPTLIMNSLDDPFLEVSLFHPLQKFPRRWNWNITGREVMRLSSPVPPGTNQAGRKPESLNFSRPTERDATGL